MVFSGVDGHLLHSFLAYDRNGAWVAAGDVNGDGRADIITGAEATAFLNSFELEE